MLWFRFPNRDLGVAESIAGVIIIGFSGLPRRYPPQYQIDTTSQSPFSQGPTPRVPMASKHLHPAEFTSESSIHNCQY
jgi:hypothetical protein